MLDITFVLETTFLEDFTGSQIKLPAIPKQGEYIEIHNQYYQIKKIIYCSNSKLIMLILNK
jgi:hypothetical protein